MIFKEITRALGGADAALGSSIMAHGYFATEFIPSLGRT
jgi:hypothetical protein